MCSYRDRHYVCILQLQGFGNNLDLGLGQRPVESFYCFALGSALGSVSAGDAVR